MSRSLAFRTSRYRVLLVGAAALLTVTAGALPRAPSSIIDGPAPITDPVGPFHVLLQAGPIEIPIPTSDPFIG